jgi:O-antigen ligase
MTQGKTNNYWNKENILMGIGILFFISLFYSKFLLSLTLFSFVFLAIANEELRFSFSGLKALARRYKSDPVLWSFGLIFLGVLLSMLYSSNVQQGLKHAQLKLPFLVLPLAFAGIKVERSMMLKLIYAFVGIAFLSAVIVSITYLLDYNYYNDLIGKGQSLPTPIQHVSYSIIMSFAAVSAFILFLEDELYVRLKYPVLIIGVLLFLFMHLLAVRSGIVTMYLGLFLLILKRIFVTKKYLQGFGCLAICIVAPLLAYYFIPSFYNKVGYMLWDFKQMLQNKTVNYSDGGRLLSYQLGWDLFTDNPWLGTSLGDFKEVCSNWYQANVADYTGKLNFPHNQFLFSLASTGIIGFIIYQIGIWLPFIKGKMFRNSFSLCLYAIVVTSFLVETQLERSAVICFFLFFAMVIYRGRD